MSEAITLFLCGDVMTGRGIDQILPHSSDRVLHEAYVRDALDYVELAEKIGTPIPRMVPYSYVWGDALKEFERVKPDLKIINLETTVTKSEEWLPKGINYRMHPENLPCITAAKIDCCVLANNHMLDFGYTGLLETLDCLSHAELSCAGAGRNRAEAERPAVLNAKDKQRVLVFSFGMETSGIPFEWAATQDRPGVAFLDDLSGRTVQHVADQVGKAKRSGDLVVFSIHWGADWSYEISQSEISFAHDLIDHAFVDVVHGHSSHHTKALELYRGKPIFYGCGDFINDYEGISGYEKYRGHLGLMYFVEIDRANGKLVRLEMVPTQMRGLRVTRAPLEEARWLRDTLNRESNPFGTHIEFNAANRLEARLSL